MRISVRYLAQLRQAAGTAGEEVELQTASSARELVTQLAQRRGGDLGRLLLDSDGRLHPTILLFVGDEQVGPEEYTPLKEGDIITLLSPIAGG
jgi:molybdopterin converting factor small subunit